MLLPWTPLKACKWYKAKQASFNLKFGTVSHKTSSTAVHIEYWPSFTNMCSVAGAKTTCLNLRWPLAMSSADLQIGQVLHTTMQIFIPPKSRSVVSVLRYRGSWCHQLISLKYATEVARREYTALCASNWRIEVGNQKAMLRLQPVSTGTHVAIHFAGIHRL